MSQRRLALRLANLRASVRTDLASLTALTGGVTKLSSVMSSEMSDGVWNALVQAEGSCADTAKALDAALARLAMLTSPADSGKRVTDAEASTPHSGPV